MPAAATKVSRRRRKEARPGELTAAALTLFVEKGYAATRLADVAALAEGEQLVAGFAGSSDALLRAVAERLWHLIGSQRIGGIPKLVFAEAHNFPEIARFYHEEVIRRGTALVRSVIERGVARGEFRAVDVEAALHLVIAPVLMRMVWRHSMDICSAAGVTDERYFAEYHELMLRGLRAAPAEGRIE